jgi:hypothetical protein
MKKAEGFRGTGFATGVFGAEQFGVHVAPINVARASP